jgi:peptide/nickel transport system permease protein
MLGDSRSQMVTTVDVVGAETPLPEDVAHETDFVRARNQRMGIGGWLAAAWLAFAVLVAIFVPMFAKTHNVAVTPDLGFLKQGSHPFGGDDLGNNMTILLAQGLRYSLIIGFGAITFGLLIGGSCGLIGGYFRGRLDAVLTGIFNILLAIPALVLALALVAVLA